MLNPHTNLLVPDHSETQTKPVAHAAAPAAQTAAATEQTISAATNAVVSFETAKISSTPAPVAPVADTQSDDTTNPTTPESTTTASPVVQPIPAAAAKKTSVPAPEPVAAPVVAAAQVPVAAISGLGSRIASAALAQLGVQQDCTMLVTNSLAAVGIHFHGWPADYISLGRIVPASQAQVGDLVYYQNGGMGLAHIAVYIGNGQAVHGGWNGETTAIASVNIGSGPVFIHVGG